MDAYLERKETCVCFYGNVYVYVYVYVSFSLNKFLYCNFCTGVQVGLKPCVCHWLTCYLLNNNVNKNLLPNFDTIKQ